MSRLILATRVISIGQQDFPELTGNAVLLDCEVIKGEMVLRYFGIRVSDLEESIRFYTELLGLKVKRQGQMYHGGKWVLLEDPRSHQRLELNWYPENSPYSTENELGLDHIGFKVQNPASIFRKLSSKGTQKALIPTDKNGVKGIYYLKDPDGNWIEFFG